MGAGSEAAKQSGPRQVLILTGDGGEELEVYYPHERLRESGYTPVVASLEAKELSLKLHQQLAGEDTFSEWRGRTIRSVVAVREVIDAVADYAGLVLPGGRAPEYLRLDPAVVSLVRAFAASGKPVAALCHGPMILAYADVLSGRSATAVPDIRPEIEGARAIWLDERVVVDQSADAESGPGTLVTGQTWEDCGPWMGAFMRALEAGQ